MKSDHLPRHVALLLFAVVVLAWGFNWPVTKLIVHSISPLWTATFRSLIAAVVLLGLLWGQGNLIVPRRGDLPVVFGIALPHMVAFSTLVAIGLQFVPAGRAIVLGYTTPLWVVPAARLFLGEPITTATSCPARSTNEASSVPRNPSAAASSNAFLITP